MDMGETTRLATDENSAREFIEECLNEQAVEQIAYVMERCKSKVGIVAVLEASSDPGKHKAAMYVRFFLEKFAEVTNMVQVSIYERDENPEIETKIDTEYYPAIALFAEDGEYSGVCFHGFPGGHELEAFILAIYNLAGPGQPLAGELKERISALNSLLNLKICVSLSCNVCPELVEAGNRFAILNPMITTEVFDLECFTELFDRFDIPSVPAMIINNNEVLFGRRGIKELLEALEQRR